MEGNIHFNNLAKLPTDQVSNTPTRNVQAVVHSSDGNGTNTGPPGANRSQKNRGVSDNFMKTIIEYNKKHNNIILEQPQIAGTPVNLYFLYGYVLKAGGSAIVDEKHQWDMISASAGFPGREKEIAEIHHNILREYETEWLAKRRLSQPKPRVEAVDGTLPRTLPTPIQPMQNQFRVSDEISRPSPASETRPPSSMDARTIYKPLKRTFDTYAGLDIPSVVLAAKDKSRLRPYPSFQELGHVDIQGITRSIESRLPAEVGNALDIMAVIANDKRWGLPLLHCGDLLEVLIDCMLENLECLQRLSHESSTCVMSYNQLYEKAKQSTLYLKSPQQNTLAHGVELEAKIQQIMAIMTILRNLAFTEVNQEPIARTNQLISTLAQGIALFCNEVGSEVITSMTCLDFAKDIVTLLALIGTYLVIDDLATFKTIFHFLLGFSGSVVQSPYTAAAIDALAKILSRDIPNRSICETLLKQETSRARQKYLMDLLALAHTYVPSNTSEKAIRTTARRIPLLQHTLLIAEFTADMSHKTSELSKTWATECASVSNRFIVLNEIMASPFFLASNLMNEYDIKHMRMRITSVIKTLLEQCSGSFSSTNMSIHVMSRAERLVYTNQADVDL